MTSVRKFSNFLKVTSLLFFISSITAAGTLKVTGGIIEVQPLPKPFAKLSEPIDDWIKTGARAVVSLYGKFPYKKIQVFINVKDYGDDIFGQMSPKGYITARLPATITDAELKKDWVMTHEMFHLAFPDLDNDYLWMQEGLSSYLEPMGRGNIGTLSDEQIWKDLAWGLKKGLPESDDEGLNNTHTWGRTYWGGALFWLMVDVEIREKSHGRKTLDDSLRAILNAGGNGSTYWKIEKVLDVGDKATGLRTLHESFKKYAEAPGMPDLAGLLQRLGVKQNGKEVALDDGAPLALLRKSLTRRSH